MEKPKRAKPPLPIAIRRPRGFPTRAPDVVLSGVETIPQGDGK
jgi:hypothetical protein